MFVAWQHPSIPVRFASLRTTTLRACALSPSLAVPVLLSAGSRADPDPVAPGRGLVVAVGAVGLAVAELRSSGS